MATKIIITNKMALENKYGKRDAESILFTLNMMVSMDIQIRGISSFVLLLDNKNQMAMYGAKNVTDSKDEKQVKDAIDKVYKTNRPDYILLLGGSDIIPHQNLKDPRDENKVIQSDLPYASNASYDRCVDPFIFPERKVSRLPDTSLASGTVVSQDAKNFIQIIVNASKQMSGTDNDYKDYFAVISHDFIESKKETVRLLFGNDEKLQCCPPHDGNWKSDQYSCLLHYFALYGRDQCSQWFEDKAYKTAVYECEKNKLYLNKGTIVIGECSYSAQLFGTLREKPICNVYMESKACAFLGSTCELYGEGKKGRSDILAVTFLNEIKNKKTIAEAFLSARNKVIENKEAITLEEKVVLAQWVLFGDGSYQPIK